MADRPGIEVLTGVPLYAGLRSDELGELLEISEMRSADAGETLVTEGQPSPVLFLLLRGACEVRKAGTGGQTHVLATLGDKSVFGEVGIVAPSSVATASVVTTAPAELLTWQRPAIRARLEAGSTAAFKVVANLAEVLAGRLRRMNDEWQKLVEAATTAGAPAEKVREFASFKSKLLKDWAF
ncbi:MAG: Crp/Fnr family transcriptional regulator [Planctomycetales bacterium]|nr:Crp/Fnr family transcriptional regulator [Planctomycetales bacterium]